MNNTMSDTVAATTAGTADAAGELGVARVSALVTFDLSVNVGDTCPLAYHVDATATTFYVGEIGTSAIVVFADQALATLATVTADAVTALLSTRDTPGWMDSPSVVDRVDDRPADPEVWIGAGIAVADGCPISFQLNRDCVDIVVLDTATLCLTFRWRGLMEFARLASEAAGTMLDARRRSRRPGRTRRCDGGAVNWLTVSEP